MTRARNSFAAPAWIAATALAFAALGAGAARAEGAADLSIGVAPFERVGDLDADVPDVSLMLARRLGTMGVGRVASPRDLGGTPAADPDARTAAEWARRGGVSSIVVGRTTSLGGKLSIDARVRDGATGQPMGRRFFAEVAKPRDLPAAVDQLAVQVIEQAREAPVPATATTAVGAPPPAAVPAAAVAPTPAVESPAPAARAEGRSGDGGAPPSDAPISIKSDVLDVFEEGGRRRFVFAGNVRAKQADLAIRSERLEAFYAANASEPERIVASGSVTMNQSGRTARCNQATFYRKTDRIVCVGDVAEVEQGCDVVRGKEIEFFTASQKLKVHGAADVRITPDAACKAAGGGGQ